MKAADFKREHFAKGGSFSQADFDAYIRASETLAKSAGVKYLAFVGGGVLLSLVFSKGVGGFIGNMLSAACIFAGLIVGGISNMKASREVSACAAKLGITKEDVKAARQHVKNGTVAWSGVGTGAAASAPAPARAAAVAEAPKRAVYAAGIMIGCWFTLLILQCMFGLRPQFCADSLFLTVAALYAAAIYLVTRPATMWKLFGGGAGLTAVLLSAHSTVIAQNIAVYAKRLRFGDLMRMIDPGDVQYVRALGGALLSGLATLAAAWVVYNFIRRGDDKRRSRRAALAGTAAFLLLNVLRNLLRARGVLSHAGLRVMLSVLGSPLLDAACLFLVFVAIYALCSMPDARVKLRGIGLVWAWIAAAGMVVSLISVISEGTGGDTGVIIFTAQFILAALGLCGYIMLLCKRRVGLYVILLGMGVMLGAQFSAALAGVLAGARQYFVAAISILLGGLNPLFAWLAVRSADKRRAAPPVYVQAPANRTPPPAPVQPQAILKDQPAVTGGRIRHIVCLCYDAPYINAMKPQMQSFILDAEQRRGSTVTPTSRITFESFYDNDDLERPESIRQKLAQVYSPLYGADEAKALADQTTAREVQHKDGHTLVKYFVLYA
ncbi:MAG: hypothetical protein Q4E65_07385 [Clostridia bacterium]|nr:hypothetical protein [Clostridia bacterium]